MRESDSEGVETDLLDDFSESMDRWATSAVEHQYSRRVANVEPV